MPCRFLEISVFLRDCFIMPHPVYPSGVSQGKSPAHKIPKKTRKKLAANQRTGCGDKKRVSASRMVVVVHRGSSVQRHQLQRLKVDANNAVLTIAGRRQLTGQR